MLFSNRNRHLGTMSVIIDANVLNISEVVKIDKKYLSHKWCRLIIKIFMMKMVKRF